MLDAIIYVKSLAKRFKGFKRNNNDAVTPHKPTCVGLREALWRVFLREFRSNAGEGGVSHSWRLVFTHTCA